MSIFMMLYLGRRSSEDIGFLKAKLDTLIQQGNMIQDIKGEMKSAANLKGDPADHAVHDEYDEMDPKIDEFIDGRLARSPIHTKSYLANPTIPDYMIDKKFQQSSMEYWHIRCRHCKRYTCLDLDNNFPKLFHEKQDGSDNP